MLDGSLVIPIFFYSAHGELYAKCIRPRTSGVVSKDNVKLLIPNYLPYRSEHLFSVKCSDFNRIYSEILINGVMVERLYGNCIWGQLLMMLSMQLNQTDRNVTSPHVIGIGDGVSKQIPFPNPWRLRAGGRVIRHMPITLYADDTSGNLSKQWNKHISYFFTLSGLPPSETNQQYNCHFLSTSNTAGVLELADQIVDEIK